ncbi:MAG: ParB/RepB/Spo0J family partition protein [Gammaproteobacteria bacterium]
MKRKGLGRGLDALMGDGGDKAAAREGGDGGGLREVPLAQLRPGKGQPRKHFDEGGLRALADSIRLHGFLQPIVARPLPEEEGMWEIIAGERRWRAAKLAGKAKVPVVERNTDAHQAAALALVENLQRADLNPMEQSRGLAQLIADGDLTHAQAGAAVGMSRAAVSNLLRLAELSAGAAELAQSGKLPMAHARALLSLPQTAQDKAARTIVDSAMSAREAEEYVRQISGKSSRISGGKNAGGGNIASGGKDAGDGNVAGDDDKENTSSINKNTSGENTSGNKSAGGGGNNTGGESQTTSGGDASKDADTAMLEKELSAALSAQVRISHHPSGKGTLTIYYGSLTTLQSAITRLRKKPRL